MRLFITSLLLLSALSHAERVRVAVHPLVARGVEDSVQQKVADDMRNVLAEPGKITAAAEDEVEDALRALATRQCPAALDDRMKCLEGLAFTTGSTYGLLVELKQYGRSYELSAVMVAADHTQLTQPAVVRAQNESEIPAALRRLLNEELKLTNISAASSEMARLLAHSDSSPDGPPPLVPVEDDSPQRVAGQGLLFGGLAVAVAGGVVTAVGAGVGGGVQSDGNGNAASLRDVAERNTANTLLTIGLVGVGVGAVAAVVGGILWGTAPQPSVSVAPVPGGAMLQIGGSF